MVEIEKNIPFPVTTGIPHRYSGFPRKWPWPTMKPGDSFTVTTYAVMASARNSFRMHRETVHCKIPPAWFVATKKLSGNRANGVYRLWLLDRENPETPVDTAP
jgi:hypothetical protein